MTLLESIGGPRRPEGPQPGPAAPSWRARSATPSSRRSSAPAATSGPNLGVVELTIALHRVFDSPRDRIVFDTGHQSYVHKLLTGRQAEFGTLRQRGGMSGYPSRAESEHDIVENSHASTSLSYADGLAKAYQLRGETDRRRGRGHRRRRADRRHGLGGAEQHRRGQGLAGWSSWSTTTAGPTSRRSAAWPTTWPSVRISQRYENVLDYIKTTLSRTPAGRAAAVRHAARHQEGPQGRPAAAGAVRGPRPEVPRPDRRPRRGHGRAGAAPGQATTAARCWCT